MNSKPRAASIKALEDCSFATLSKKDYDNIIGQAMRRDFEAKTTVLINIPAFKHLTRNTLKMLTFYMKEKTYNKNTILFNEGDPVKGLFLVKEGEFELSTKFNVKLDEKYKTQALPVTIKREIKFWVIGKNEVLGINSVMQENPTFDFTCKCISSTGRIYFQDLSEKATGTISHKLTHMFT